MSDRRSRRRRELPTQRDVTLDEEEQLFLFQEREDRQTREAEKAREDDRQTRWYNMQMLIIALFVIGSVLVTIQFIVLFGDKKKDPDAVTDKTQDSFGSTPVTAFVDDAAIDLITKTMLEIDAACIPPETSDVMIDIRNLQPADVTNANLAGLFRRMRTAVVARCDFYGLRAAEFRADLLPTPSEPLRGISPADMCHGYVHAGLTAMLVRENAQIPVNLKEISDFIYFKAYPLNIFWPVLGVPNAETFEAILLTFLRTAIDNIDESGFEVTQNAKAFCNPYFVGPAEVGYYNNRTQPWLGFPFPGAMQRTGHNAVSPVASRILTNLTLSAEFAVHKVFTFGDVLDTPAVALFLDALFKGFPQENFPDPDISENFATVFEQVTDDEVGFFLPDETPILILGRWAQDPSAYSSFREFEANILYGVTDITATPGANEDINVNVTEQTHAPDVISVLDFTTTLGYEARLGAAFVRELDVAEIIGTIVRGQNSLAQTDTSILEDTFAVKGVIIDGEDIGMRAAARAAEELAKQQGFGTGFIIPAGSITMISDVQTEPTFVFGAAPLPKQFDWRETSPGCMGPVINQGSCNSCWAVSTGDALGSRACIKGLTSRYGMVSVQHITSCSGDADKNGCIPDSPYTSFTFTSSVGAIDSQCFPYKNAGKSREISCRSICDTTNPGASFSKFTTSGNTHTNLRGVETIKREIFTNGPVPIGFQIPSDLCDVVDTGARRTAVYTTPNIGSSAGGSGRCGSGAHLVVAVGWNDNVAEPYWIIKNSWGSTWADGGYFRVKQNMVGWLNKEYPWFEQHAYVAQARRVQDFGRDEPVPAPSSTEPVLIVNEDQATAVAPDRPSAAVATRPAAGVILIMLFLSFIVFM